MEPDARQPPPPPPVPTRRRRTRMRAGWVAAGIAATVTLGGIAALVWFVFSQLVSLVPFAETRSIDRTQDAVQVALADLSEFRAATGRFQVIVDIERDVSGVPSQIAGERVLFVAQGSVDAMVDFSHLDATSVRVDSSRDSVSVLLPRAQLSDAVVDTEASYVFERERGLLDRLGGIFSDNPTSERALYLAAEDRLTEAAAASELVDQAERNTTAMLEGLLGSLGFSDIRITYGP